MRDLFPHNNFVPPRMGGLRLAVAEAPGAEEAAAGEPLVGTAGKWLRGSPGEGGRRIGGLYYKAGVRDEELTLVNCINCRPPENVFPTDPDARSYISVEAAERAVEHCLDAHVRPLLRARPWKRVDLLGEKALRFLTGKEGGIKRWRGSPLELKDLPVAGAVAIATLHPSAIARDQTLIPAVISDLKKSLTQPPELYVPRPSLAQVQAFTSRVFAFDIETNPATQEILCVGLSAERFHAICVPFAGAYIPELKRIFAAAEILVGQNSLQFDLPILAGAGIAPPAAAQLYDTMLMQHLLAPDLPHGLDFLGSIFTNKPAWKHLSDEDMELYCCRDVDVTFQCWQQLKPLLVQENLLSLYELVQVPLAKICRLMYDTGVRVNPGRIAEARTALKAEALKLEANIPEKLRTRKQAIKQRQPAPPGTLGKSGKPVKYVMVDAEETVQPWRSPDVIKEWLYEELALPLQTNPKTHKISTDKFALEKLLRQCRKTGKLAEARSIEALQRLRKVDELLTTFVSEAITQVERVHPHFNVHGTASGRLSSSEPNLQNIPESARIIYVPDYDDWEWASVDFSQIENRLTAHFARDHERMQRFLVDPNFSEHKFAASLFFNIPIEDVQKDNDKDAPYGKAKRIVHGVNYGMGPRKIVNMYDMDFREVRELIAKWKGAIAPTSKWQEETAAQAKRDGVLTTPFGRKRWFYCAVPETKTLTEDLRWVEVGSLKEGDTLIAFDEEPSMGKGYGRKYQKATVTATGREKMPCYKVVTDRGTVTVSFNHPFLVDRKKGGSQYVWRQAQHLEVGARIAFLAEPWEHDTSNEAGWLAGFLDGEGSVARYAITAAQKPGAVLSRAQDWFTCKGFWRGLYMDKRDVGHIQLTSRLPDALRLLGTLRPVRLLGAANKLWEGHRIWGKWTQPASVLSLEFLGEREVVALSTSTKTVILNGLLSHNTTSYFTESLSFLPQSTAADIIYRAMIGLMWERIGWPLQKALQVVKVAEPLPEPAKLILQVHDELDIIYPRPMRDKVLGVVQRVMEQPFPELGGLSIPIGISCGPSWGEVKKYKLES